jgi:hypothetical protein
MKATSNVIMAYVKITSNIDINENNVNDIDNIFNNNNNMSILIA